MEQDTVIKGEAYARAGVPELWLVRPATRDILMCNAPDAAQGDYRQTQLVPEQGDLIPATIAIQFSVASLFAGAPDTAV